MTASTDHLQALVADIQQSVARHSAGDSGSEKQKLLKSISELQRAIETPDQYVQRLRLQPLQHVCFLMAIETGTLEAMVISDAAPTTAAELSTKTGYNELLIVRIMRMLVALGICDQVGPRTYMSNQYARALNSTGSKGGIGIFQGMVLPIACKLRPYLRQPNVRESHDELADNGPLQFAFGMPMFELLRSNPELKKVFDDNMAGRNKLHKVKWHEKYPAAAQLGPGADPSPDAVFIVDVAGNQGYDIASFKARHPDIPGKFVLQDLPETLRKISPPLTGVDAVEYDFFTPQPVHGARAYYFHSIFHDWSDGKSRQILSNTAQAMRKGYSRLLIDDMVLADVGEGMTGAEMDILMMMLPSGLERSLSQWTELLASVEPPLEIVKVWSTSGEYQAILELQLH